MKPSTEQSSRSFLPWPLIGAAITAMAASYSTSRGFIGLPFLALIVVASRLVPWRLPRSRMISWGLRVGIAGALLTAINGLGDQDNTVWYLKRADTNLVGYALAAELALRAWERREPTAMREWIGAGLLITALLFAAATNSYDKTPIQLLTPLYCIWLVLTLRSMALADQGESRESKQRAGLITLRAVVLSSAMAASFTGIYLVTHYESTVTNWAVRMFRKGKTAQNEIGFSTTPRLSNVFNPLPSPDRVLIINGRTTDGHLRVMSFDTYSQQVWSPAIGDRQFWASAIKGSLPEGVSPMHIERLGDTADLLPVPLVASSVSAAEPLERDQFDTVRDTLSGAGLSYDVQAAASPLYQGPLASVPDSAERKRLLALPAEVDPRIRDIAIKAAGEGTADRKLSRIQQYLRTNHQYSLSYNPQGEPLSDFILNNRSAHCQYFASAMVMLSRAAGIPARYVTGFFAHEPYGTDTLVVRQRDAHAWTECFIDGVGWVTIDATPATGLPSAVYPDQSWWERWREKLSDIPGKVRMWLQNKTPLFQRVLVIGAPVAIVGWIIKRLFDRRKRVADTDGYSNPNAELVDLSRRFGNWLEVHEMPCPPHRTWREHLADLPQVRPREFVKLYDQARFGIHQPEAIGTAKAALSELEHEVT